MFKSLKEGQEVISSKIDSNTEEIRNLETQVTSEIEMVKSRLEKIERPEFDPERTIVLEGLKPHNTDSDKDMVQSMLRKIGIDCEIVNIKRLTSYNAKPGIIKCEVLSEKIKVDILRVKSQLKAIVPDVYMRSSKPHLARVMEQNTRMILKMLAEDQNAREYRVSASGKIVRKEEAGYYSGWQKNTQWPSLPSQTEQQDDRVTSGSQNGQLGRGARGPRIRGGRGYSTRGYRGRGERGRGGTHSYYNSDRKEERLKRDRPGSLESPPREGPPQPFQSSSPGHNEMTAYPLSPKITVTDLASEIPGGLGDPDGAIGGILTSDKGMVIVETREN